MRARTVFRGRWGGYAWGVAGIVVLAYWLLARVSTSNIERAAFAVPLLLCGVWCAWRAWCAWYSWLTPAEVRLPRDDRVRWDHVDRLARDGWTTWLRTKSGHVVRLSALEFRAPHRALHFVLERSAETATVEVPPHVRRVQRALDVLAILAFIGLVAARRAWPDLEPAAVLATAVFVAVGYDAMSRRVGLALMTGVLCG